MRTMLTAACALALGLAAGPGVPARAEIVNTVYGPRPVTSFGHRVSAQQHLVLRAAAAIRDLKSDTALAPEVRLAKGVFVMPAPAPSTQAASGANAVALARHGGASWTGPAFYRARGLRAPFVVVLLSERALAKFAAGGKVTLGPASGLRIVDAATARRSGAAGADAIVWSEPSGHDTASRLSRAAIVSSKDDNEAYYNQAATAREVLDDEAPNPGAERLWHALEG